MLHVVVAVWSLLFVDCYVLACCLMFLLAVVVLLVVSVFVCLFV